MSKGKSALRKAADDLGLGDLRISHRRLADEPLTEDDWRVVYLAYLAFQQQMRLIVLEARRRPKPTP